MYNMYVSELVIYNDYYMVSTSDFQSLYLEGTSCSTSATATYFCTLCPSSTKKCIGSSHPDILLADYDFDVTGSEYILDTTGHGYHFLKLSASDIEVDHSYNGYIKEDPLPVLG